MINLNNYIIEKLRITKDTKYETIINKAYEIVKDMLDEAQYKYDIRILDIKTQSLYNLSDYGDDKYIHIEFTRFIKKDELSKFIGYIHRELRFNKVPMIGMQKQFSRNGNKPGLQYLDLLVKKDA